MLYNLYYYLLLHFRERTICCLYYDDVCVLSTVHLYKPLLQPVVVLLVYLQHLTQALPFLPLKTLYA